jgi:hypothetical protein
MSTATLLENPEISLLPSREAVQAQLVKLQNHPINQVALKHTKALGIDGQTGLLPVFDLARWAITNRPGECTYQHSSEAEITLAEWNRVPGSAVKLVSEYIRLDDFAEMSPEEAAVSLMLMFTA